MKNILTILLVLGISVKGFSQENTINLSVILTNSGMEELNTAQKQKIERKLYTMVTNHGIAGDSYFVLFPKYEIYNETLVEGLQNLTVLDIEFSLFVKEIQTGRIYGSLTQTIQAQGPSKRKAIDKSISKINTSGDEVEAFLSKTKKDIMNYYESNCVQIDSEATELIKQERFKEAIALLYAIPKSTGNSCYTKIQDKLNEAYLGYMNATCEDNIIKAKNAIKNNKNKDALEVLEDIEQESSCYEEAKQLSLEIGGGISKTSSSGKTEGVAAGGGVTATSSTTKDKTAKAEAAAAKRRAKRVEAVAASQYRSRHEKFMMDND
ncbi:MAG: hypothetical protein AAFX55_05610 [Bacteroidota bacterium]